MTNTERIKDLERVVTSLTKAQKQSTCKHNVLNVKLYSWEEVSTDATCAACGRRFSKAALTGNKNKAVLSRVYKNYK